MPHAVHTCLIWASILSGCGYAVVGGGPLFGTHTIAVMPFDEATPLGMSPDITQSLARLLASDGVQLTTDRAASPVLSGAVISAATTKSATTASASAQVPAYKLVVRLKAQLTDPHGQQLWTTTFSMTEDFLAPTTPGTESGLQAETNRRRAVRRLAQRAAHELHTRLRIAAATRKESR